MMKALIWIIAIAFVLFMCSRMNEPRTGSAAVAPEPAADRPACTVSMISVRVERNEWIDECRRSPCPVLRGTATVTNRCQHPVGVEVKAVLVDASGRPLQARTLWPESNRNLPVGDSVISLDQWVDHHPQGERLILEPVQVRRW